MPGPYRSAVQKKRAKVALHSLFAFCGLAVEVFLVLKGVPGVLDIVIVVQGIQQLAHQLQLRGYDMDKNVITRIETNKRFVTDVEIKAFSEVFEISYEYLIDGIE